MKFLLDTNICIYIIKQKPSAVLKKFKAYNVGDIGISSITVAELEFGVQKSQSPGKNQQALAQFLLPLTVVDFDLAATTMYGIIRSKLEKQETPIGSLDTLTFVSGNSLS
ncbi:PilT protein domain protein [Stanieria cyanosphaera PCC 7437]|uniref:PilT protein domain protein n=1 Tax=Stanieria cyanosphaera (strain ATCC 29371 / PCC 7437) TaxID=111780 RepID=K9XNC6_STAC7|nr:type II toxin-antitoxin system VapC family toxin [Stanieria cyanosphaera]AFZ34100.1 PilT protein domain protein [Stanieria cyanosphaera PCC 7437]